MKICPAIVIYNPERDAVKNVENLLKFNSEVLVLDNSDKESDFSREISLLDGVTYISFSENKGIACALKYAADFAVSNEFDYLLTMDQDSRFPWEKKEEIIDILKENNTYSILALNYNGEHVSDERVSRVDDWISSGSFIKVEDYKKIEGFNPELFIDYVDYDVCEQFDSKGLKIGVINHISIVHQLGDPLTKRVLWKKLTYSNHSPLRDYYRYRNELYLYKKNKKYFKSLHKAERKNLILILLLEKDRFKKLRMILLGKRHARKKHLGKLDVIK